MARKSRVEFEGALYHVIAQGNQRRDIFLSILANLHCFLGGALMKSLSRTPHHLRLFQMFQPFNRYLILQLVQVVQNVQSLLSVQAVMQRRAVLIVPSHGSVPIVPAVPMVLISRWVQCSNESAGVERSPRVKNDLGVKARHRGVIEADGTAPQGAVQSSGFEFGHAELPRFENCRNVECGAVNRRWYIHLKKDSLRTQNTILWDESVDNART
jgi:hypothetical protein